MQNNPIKPNTKIRILSPEHSEYVQRLAFEAGFVWCGTGAGYYDLKEYPKVISFYQDTEIATYEKDGATEIFIDLPADLNSRILSEKAGSKHNHYFKDVSDLDEIDVYRVCDLFEINDASGAIQHALKKILCPGQRGVKDYRKDLEEARDSIQRKLDIMAEDGE